MTQNEQIITEYLRLYAPLWGLCRWVYEPVKIAGFEIPPSVTIMTSPVITHRDPRRFEQADEFRPERWAEEFRSQLPLFAYFPFGGEASQCIGEGIAWMEMKIVSASLCQRWRFRFDRRRKARMLPRTTLLPKGGMPGTVERGPESRRRGQQQLKGGRSACTSVVVRKCVRVHDLLVSTVTSYLAQIVTAD